jgi:hypothetical protein
VGSLKISKRIEFVSKIKCVIISPWNDLKFLPPVENYYSSEAVCGLVGVTLMSCSSSRADFSHYFRKRKGAVDALELIKGALWFDLSKWKFGFNFKFSLPLFIF